MSDIFVHGETCSPQGSGVPIISTLRPEEGSISQRVLSLTGSGEATAVVSPRQEGGVLEVVKCDVVDVVDNDEHNNKIDETQGPIELHEGQIVDLTRNCPGTERRRLFVRLEVRPSTRESDG